MSTPYDPTRGLETIRQVAQDPPEAPLIVERALAEFAALDEWMSGGGRPPDAWRTKRRGRPPLTQDGYVNPDLKMSQHGTRYGYNHGCKCVPCRAANRGEDPSVIRAMKQERGWT